IRLATTPGGAFRHALRFRLCGPARGNRGLSIRGDESVSRPLPEDVPARDEVERLMLLVEASSRLLGSPSLETVLPAVLELAQRIFAADAYALWRRDVAADSWWLEISAGLSTEYREAAGAAIGDSSSR